MKGIIGNIILGMIFLLFGGAIVEISFLADDGITNFIVGLGLGLIFIIPGISLLTKAIKRFIELKTDNVALSEALKNDENDKKQDPFRRFLIDFREHYSDFFEYTNLKENEKIQWEATQLYRNILEFRKNRLKKLDITCETIVKSMQFNRPEGISKNKFSDGKYDITEIEEEITAKTIYKKDGQKIFSQTDSDLAYYTIIHTKQLGDNEIICPSCGIKTTREELLDGCDYCGTKFMIEDLNDRVAEFAIRPDYEVAYTKYKKLRNKFAIIIAICIVPAIVAVQAIATAPEVLADPEVGILFTIFSLSYVTIVISICLIPIALFMYAWLIPIISIIFGGINLISKAILKRLKAAPEKDKSFTEYIQKYDPNFSISNFYSGLQNKISSVIYADTKSQLEAFATGDLSQLLGRYNDVINVEMEYMGIVDYNLDEVFQQMTVEVLMKLLEYKNNKCRFRNENWKMKLVKSASCKTQVLCAPAVMICKSCGTSLDLLKGKECSYCGNKLELEKYDWAIQEIEFFKMK